MESLTDATTENNCSLNAATGAPLWFQTNIGQPGTSIHTPVKERLVHMLAWNWERAHLPTLMLVHGFGAHAHWWSYLAPFFSDKFRVLALDLPGMGDSEPPLTYTPDCFANAIVGCIEKHDLQPATIVGHSFGGAQSLRAMAMSPQLFSHGIVVDSNVRLPPDPPIRNLQPKGEHKLSRSQSECEARFRLVPPQPNYSEHLINHIAKHSCKKSEGGWHWKADPNCINVGEIDGPEILQATTTPIDLIYGEKSFLNINDKPSKVLKYLPKGDRLIAIPEAGHHIMVDYPLELVSSIKSLLL